ncbi:unnamed protein product [Ambrosiozyma monospora]|uniref:Unnamed protein product n=1 Tax=Ambrosiozyma monospora TaxID=43982 RepID=A0ACB5U0V9_AMBMO|nr:unnamed protein product [Ambrosiozyma monospora]
MWFVKTGQINDQLEPLLREKYEQFLRNVDYNSLNKYFHRCLYTRGDDVDPTTSEKTCLFNLESVLVGLKHCVPVTTTRFSPHMEDKMVPLLPEYFTIDRACPNITTDLSIKKTVKLFFLLR